jgi:hypothetical protein
MIMNARVTVFVLLLAAFSSVPAFSKWTEPVPVIEVNTEYEEWSPFLSFDGLILYFGRLQTPGNYYGRIFEAIRNEPDGPFTTIRQVPGMLNSLAGHVLCPWVSPDNLRMYYYTQVTGVGWKLMVSERATSSDPWPQGTEIYELNALGSFLTAPRLTADELTIFFQAVDLPGGSGRHDIWMASRCERDLPFEYVRNLSEINTAATEAHPNISPDGLTLYFVSDRNGFEQIFKATRTSRDMFFSNIEHLSFLDTENECSSFPFITSDAKILYFVRYKASDRSTRDIYVSYLIDNSYYVDSNSGSDLNDGTSSQNAFATIQKAVDTAPDGYTILVKPGTYSGLIDFKGKAITIEGQAGPRGIPILEAPDDFTVAFTGNEGPESVLKNVIIKNSFMGIFLVGGSPTIKNVTIIDNVYGIGAYGGASPDISNCIFWNNLNGDLSGCISRNSLTTEQGEGNIYADPLFFDPNNDDYHLKSERGRYWPEYDVWVLDKVTSPCIDAGNPSDAPSGEPMPNGGAINIGAYGGTAYASMSEMPFPEPDFNHDGIIDESDLSVLVEQWLAVSGWIE